jgi:polyisoprenoid-binding protein YceI
LIRRTALVAALAAAFIIPVQATAADFNVDVNHTQAEFTVTHLALSKVRGQIPLTAGTVTTGQTDLPTAVSVTLSAKDLDTHSADRDRDLRGPDWFDVTKFPTMTFVSKKIEGTPQAFTMSGDLTMHGVTKPVTLTGQYLGKLTDARGRTHVGYTATTTIDRREWGLLWGNTTPGGALIAAFDVAINLNVEAVGK